MIKKIILIVLILSLELLNNPGFAAQKKRRAPDESKIIQGSVNIGSQEKHLKSQEWIIYLVPINDEFAKPQMDILSFSNNKFNSRNLSSRGFKEFDYALSEAEGAVSWEASQAVDSGEIASWHAELKDKSMRGVLSILKKDGSIEDLYFTTQAVKEDAPVTKQPDQKPKKAR